MSDVDFKINDVVVHCREGLSTIISSSEMNGKEYFLVKTNRDSEETIYVPKASANTIIRHIMNADEADEILSFMKTIERDFNPNTKQRRDAFKRSLSSGDVKEIAYLSRLLYFFDLVKDDENCDIKLGPVDIDMLSFADNMLMDELALSYKVEREKIKDFIIKKMEKTK